MLHKMILLLALLLASLQLFAQSVPDWFMTDMERMVGKWVTDNSRYRSEQEPVKSYVMKWHWGSNKQSVIGRMYGTGEGGNTGDLWEFRQYWDFGKKAGIVVQYSWNGTRGIGELRSLNENNTELLQVFTTPDGASFSHGHRSMWQGDTLITSSFQVSADGNWSPDRSYRWNRPTPFPLKTPASYFPADKAQVLVAGTFHFGYPDLDLIKSDENDRIDVLKEPKKSEVTSLVEYIKRFRPNKIAIEASDEWNATRKLREYNTGQHREERDERFQVAIRIASELHLDTLYAIDVKAVKRELTKTCPDFVEKTYAGFDYRSDDPNLARMFTWREEEDAAIGQVSLLDYFKFSNSRDYHQSTLGVYLLGDFKLDNLRGADALSLGWYNRNLRIFRKLQEIADGPEDRILVLYGNGHATILRQLLEASPEYEFVEFGDLPVKK